MPKRLRCISVLVEIVRALNAAEDESAIISASATAKRFMFNLEFVPPIGRDPAMGGKICNLEFMRTPS